MDHRRQRRRGRETTASTVAGAGRVRRDARTGRGRQPLIEARALTKRFGEYVAVDGVDFAVERGEVFGFLGPNGAGKTTTMRMIVQSRPSRTASSVCWA